MDSDSQPARAVRGGDGQRQQPTAVRPDSPAAGGCVLVLDGGSEAALSIVRSLGRRGVEVTVGAPSRFAPGLYSRFATDRYVHPSPSGSAGRFLDDLRGHLRERGYDVVFPVGDGSSVVLAANRAELEATGTRVAVEDWPRFRRANDKRQLFELLADVDVPAPETVVPDSLAALDRIAGELPYPVVVKSYSKTMQGRDGLQQLRVTDANYADSPAELRATYRSLLDDHGLAAGDLLVQEYVPGTTTATVVLAEEGEVLTHFQEERQRTYPASGGNSAVLAALHDPRMLTYAERVVAALEWTGPAMVEFMRTPAGEYYVVEVNGRYWGSLPFAVSCGVDIPWHHYRLLNGDRPEPASGYRTDRRQRRLLYEDVQWLHEQLSAGRLGALEPFARSFLSTDHTVVSGDDPVPTAVSLGRVPLTAARWLLRQ